MSNIYTSRFILQQDEKTDVCLLKIPTSWCSRCYEYKWAMNFISMDDICLDAACGIPHPFKFYLSSVCNNVYACDISDNILSTSSILSSVKHFFSEDDYILANKYINNIHFNVANLTKLPYKSNFFTKIFCIGSLKCLDLNNLTLCLKEFFRVLKKDGYLILTVDVPPVNLNKLVSILSNIGFEFVANLDLTKPNTTLCSPLPCCNNCFRLLVYK